MVPIEGARKLAACEVTGVFFGMRDAWPAIAASPDVSRTVARERCWLSSSSTRAKWLEHSVFDSRIRKPGRTAAVVGFLKRSRRPRWSEFLKAWLRLPFPQLNCSSRPLTAADRLRDLGWPTNNAGQGFLDRIARKSEVIASHSPKNGSWLRSGFLVFRPVARKISEGVCGFFDDDLDEVGLAGHF